MLKSGSNHWGGAAKFFHWTIVLLILSQAFVGLTMVNLPRSPAVIPWYTFHKSVGITVLALAVLRLAWRAFDPHPVEPAGMPRWQVLGARAGHALLYLLLFLAPLSGWLVDSASGLRPLYWFGLVQIPHLVAPDPDLKKIAEEIHESLFWILAVVALGHAAMAIVHQFVNRDNVLARMWPASLQRHPKPLPETVHVAPAPALAPVAAVDPADKPGA